MSAAAEDEAATACGARDGSDAAMEITLRMPASRVSALLRDELALIASERAAHAEDAASYEALKAAVAKVHHPTYIKLDVGGMLFKTSVNTLCAERGSVLAAMFSGSGFHVTLNDEGAYFIDRDGTHFRHILNYLRGCFDAGTVSDGARRELLVEADFYGLAGLCSALTTAVLPFKSATAEDGLLHWLGTARGTRAWVNPADAGLVKVTSTLEDHFGPPASLVARGAIYAAPGFSGACSPQPGQFWTLELLNGVTVEPTYYSLRWGKRCGYPVNWKLEAAEDANGDFVLLRQHVNDNTMRADPGQIGAWPLSVPTDSACKAFKVFRFSGQAGCFHAGCFELYGRAIFP